jgi:hypothetical protein
MDFLAFSLFEFGIISCWLLSGGLYVSHGNLGPIYMHLIIKLCLSFSSSDQSKLIPHLSCIWNTLLPD